MEGMINAYEKYFRQIVICILHLLVVYAPTASVLNLKGYVKYSMYVTQNFKDLGSVYFYFVIPIKLFKNGCTLCSLMSKGR